MFDSLPTCAIAVLCIAVFAKLPLSNSITPIKSLLGLWATALFTVPKDTVLVFENKRSKAKLLSVGVVSPFGLINTVAHNNLEAPLGICKAVQSTITSPLAKAACCFEAAIVNSFSTVKNLLIILFCFFVFI